MISTSELPEFHRRYRILIFTIVVVFAVLIGRLWQLQVLGGHRYRQLTARHSVRQERIAALRGLIFDRRGRPFATNRPAYDVYAFPHLVTESMREGFSHVLQLEDGVSQVLAVRLRSLRGRKATNRVLVLKDISRDQLARFEMHRDQFPAFSVRAGSQRQYRNGKLGAHVLGYMSDVSLKELEAKDARYQPGDQVGRFGVERMYESHLRGSPGAKSDVVNVSGQAQAREISREVLAETSYVAPKAGHNLWLTIDLDLQRIVEHELSRYASGAAIIMEVNSGRVLAVASQPSFDPNVMSGRVSPEEVQSLLDDPRRPLIDKVLRENYFPGSTFKAVTAIAALEEGVTSWRETLFCGGSYTIGRQMFRCSHHHGIVDLHHALVSSCNVFFYTLAERIGLDKIADYAHRLGLGASTGLGLNGEVSGFIPTRAWYQARKEPFRIGNTLNNSIGQGSVKATLIQVVSLYAAIANGGTLYLPQLVEKIETESGERVETFAPRVRRHVEVKPEVLAGIRKALEGVVNDRRGTAYEYRLSEIRVSGKTGTAQVVKHGRDIDLEHRDHAWFAAFAPSEAPQIAVAVLIEHGGQAAKAAAPVATAIIHGYFAAAAKHENAPKREGATPVATRMPR